MFPNLQKIIIFFVLFLLIFAFIYLIEKFMIFHCNFVVFFLKIYYFITLVQNE